LLIRAESSDINYRLHLGYLKRMSIQHTSILKQKYKIGMTNAVEKDVFTI
jgi:hypothetical protein